MAVTIGNSFPKLFIILALLGIAFCALHFTLATLRFNEHDLKQIRQTLGQRTADLSVMNEQLRHEISERQQTEAALEQQHAFLRQIIDSMPHLVFVKDKESRFLTINKALAEIYRTTPEEIEGRRGREFNPNEQEMTEFEEGDQAVLASGKEMFWPELPFTHLDGEKHWLQVVKRPLYDKTNNVIHVLGIASDITLIKKTTEALREKEENFRTLVEASFEGIIICVDHIILEANLSFATMFGYATVEEVLGKNAATFLTPESTNAVRKLMEISQKISLEATGVRQNNSTFPVEIVSHAITYQGQQAHITGYRDISTRKQAEEADQHAQKLESLSIMAGGLAHDFNNLLVAMMSQVAIAKARLNPDHASHENLDKAIQATETAALLTRQLLAYTGQGHFEVKGLHLNRLISQNLQLFQDALPANITFHTNLHDPLPHIQADSAQIQQIIMNLLLNAAEAIGTKEGTITVTTAPYQLTAGQIGQWQPINETVAAGNYVLLEVADTGRGMDEATLNRIFDPFYSTKGPGRGLGLAAVLGIIRGHSGSLRAESQLNQGTSFQFLFPCDESEEPGAEMAESPAQPRRNTVLIVDDEKQVREAIGDILDLKEIPWLAAASGQEGVTLYEAHRDKIGLVILDLSMPGMSGVETFEALREINPAAKVILSSGFTEAEILQKMAGTRPIGFLQKPYRLETVLNTVERHLS
jgi:PAS domain S-box-containing protein